MTGEAPGRAPRPAGVRGAARRWVPLALVVLLVLGAAALGGPADNGLPLDPRSTGVAGTRAVLDALRELGVDVALDEAVPDPETERALLLVDALDEEQRAEVRGWVAAGGVLVVADPRSELAPAAVGPASLGGIGIAELAPACGLAALQDVPAVLPDSAAVVLERPEGAVGCFPRGEGFWLVAEPEGEGAIVVLGGADVWMNARVDEAGHAELAAALLMPAQGPLAVLPLRLPGEGDAALVDLIGGNVELFALQLLLALLLVVAWRSRRLGRPVEEPQPVEIPGSELVTAVGNLLQEHGARDRTAGLLRDDLRRALAGRLGLPPRTPDDVLADVAAARTGIDPADLLGVLRGDPPDDEGALVALAQDIERLRADALAAPAAPTRRSM